MGGNPQKCPQISGCRLIETSRRFQEVVKKVKGGNIAMSTLAKASAILMVFFIMGTFQPAGAEAPAAVQQAAQAGLSHFLTTVPVSELANMGLMTREEINTATLGTPFEMFTITPAALNSYKSGVRLSSLISPANTWVFPVTVNGTARNILKVMLINGTWEGGSFGGGSFLPNRVMEMQSSAAQLAGQKGAAGSPSTRFVRIFQAYQDFLLIEAAGADYLYPVTGNAQLQVAGDALYTADQVIPQLKEVVQTSIERSTEQFRKKTR